MKTQSTMSGARYVANIMLMSNEELQREFESVQSLAYNTFRGPGHHVGQPHNWFSKQLSVRDLLIERGLMSVNNN